MQTSAQSATTVILPRWKRRLSVAAVVAAATTFGLTYSLSAPLIAMSLMARGHSSLFIGVNAAMHALGVLLAAPLLPGLAARLGARRLTVLALVLAGVLLFLFRLWPIVWVWFLLRIALGAAAEVLFVMSETWTNVLSDETTRGRTMAIYTAALSLGMVLGPALLSRIGVNDRAFVIGAVISVCAVLFVLPPWVLAPARSAPEPAQPLRYLKLAPVAIATTILNAGVETAGLSFIALYATGMGWSEQRAMQLISTLMLGAILLQLPIGWLADKMDKRRLALILAWISAITALLWPFALQETPLAFAMVFIWGGLFVGIYTTMLAMVGSRFQGNNLVGVYAVMGLAWGVGALVGPSAVGLGMIGSARFGLPGVIALACALFALFMMRSRSRT
ncbi:MFS transporter [Dyella caseinilytica]|uniref:MFS transporter n=1 Tax=Dyella caseinilytica TaxID=1849581 RepID=A0ABX7GZX0_9GAMM|nr:MFS transporter [Dyella caseinilytica]QRN55573.1 MFS transporter [Dyella caseinilytica]GGA02797.1 MFS transporter [Dyella caseinilytica]